MGKHFWISVIAILVFLWPQSTFADDPPNLISPPDNSTVEKSPKLIWEYSGECIENGSCFRVEVDNSSDFSSPEKSTYTNSLYYSPQNLPEGNWLWRVKAKDKAQKWSEWSKVFKFSVAVQTPSPTTIASSQISPTPQPSPTSKKAQSVFEVKNLPSEINSNQEFESQVTLTMPNSPNQDFHLKGAFKKEGSSNYFGQTYSGDWVGNSEKYSKQLKITTNSEGFWEGKIKVRPDQDDSGFDGTGSYIFKVARYSDSGSGPTWSNENNLKIIAVSNSSPSKSPEKETIALEEEEPDITASIVKQTPKTYEIKIASVAGESVVSNNTDTPEETKVMGQKNVNWFLITLGLGVFAVGSGFVLYKLRKEKLNAKSFN